jgi:hypothetical protein
MEGGLMPQFGNDFFATTGGAAPGGLTSIPTGNTLWVDADEGNDGSALPNRLDRPYQTVSAALAASTAGDLVRIRAGTYAESGLTIPADVHVCGDGWTVTTVGTSAAGSDIFTMGSNSALQGLTIACPAGAGLAGLSHTSGTGSVVAINLAGNGLTGSGWGIAKSGTGKLIGGNIRNETGGLAAVFRVNSGVLALDDTHIPQSAGTTAAGLLCEGTGIYQGQGFNLGNTNVTDGVRLTGGTVRIYSPNIFNCTNAIRLSADGVSLTVQGGRIAASALTVLVDPLLTGLGSTVRAVGTILDPLFSFPPAAAGNVDFALFFNQTATNTRETRQRLIGAPVLALGFPEKGSGFICGKGADYGEGIKVVTSDGTATSTTLGGNLTDVTTAAQSLDSSTFTFQGTGANHCIYFASIRRDAASNPFKHWGARIDTVAAAVGGSFVFEVWDGAAWSQIGAMSSSEAERYRYGSSHFIRAGSAETLYFGLTSSTTWSTTTVDGVSAYWVRCRVDSALTTAPTFERWWLEESSHQINQQGQRASTGLGQWRKTLVGAGNVFASGGTATDGTATVGTGLGTWTHALDGSKLNGSGDSVSTQFELPADVCTAHSISFKVSFEYSQYNAAPTVEGRILGVQRAGADVADPAGGKTPVARTEANTALLTATAGQVTSRVLATTQPGKIQSETFGPYSVEDLVAGDLVLFNFAMISDGGGGGAATDLQIWSVSIVGISFQDGDSI